MDMHDGGSRFHASHPLLDNLVHGDRNARLAPARPWTVERNFQPGLAGIEIHAGDAAAAA
jgi:hypothetical protein